jgi:arylsulfatase A-like enzyme
VTDRPNIVFFHVDKLGLGELGCFGGEILRGADTKRIDHFAEQGLKLSHYVIEPQCTPTRSALMTGRYPIWSGNHTTALVCIPRNRRLSENPRPGPRLPPRLSR